MSHLKKYIYTVYIEIVFIFVVMESWQNGCHPLVFSGHISVSSQSSVYIWVVAKEDGEEKIMLSGTLGGSSLKLKWAWITQFAISPETALRLILSSCSSEKDNRGACTRFKCPLLCDWQEVLFTFSAKQNHFHLKAGFKQTPEQSLFPLFPVNHITATS